MIERKKVHLSIEADAHAEWMMLAEQQGLSLTSFITNVLKMYVDATVRGVAPSAQLRYLPPAEEPEPDEEPDRVEAPLVRNEPTPAEIAALEAELDAVLDEFGDE